MSNTICILGSGPLSVSARAEGTTFGGSDKRLLENGLLSAGTHPNRVDYKLVHPLIINELNQSDYNIIVTLGERAMQIATGKKNLEKWQLSPLDSAETLKCPKVIPTFNFRRLNAQYDHRFYFYRALIRAVQNDKPGAWSRKPYNFILDPTFDKTTEILQDIRDNRETIAVDIETSHGIINTLGFAWTSCDAIAVKCRPEDMSIDQFYMFWGLVRDILESPRIRKIYQNNIFETAYFALYGIDVQNTWHDTMHANKVLYPEFKSGLGNVGRLFTMEPYWKDIGKEGDDEKRDWNKIDNWHKHLLYNCLSRDTKVKTNQGWLAIGDIVKQRDPNLLAMSYNELTQNWEYKPITNWYKNRHAEKINWVKVQTDYPYKTPRGLTLTPDHEVLTDSGWKRADELNTKDYIIDRQKCLNDGALIGTLLGDSSAGNTSRSTKKHHRDYKYLTCSQISKQLITLKQGLFGGTITTAYRETGFGSNQFYTLYVQPNKQIGKWANLKKTNIKQLLNNINSIGLALWYMDDGCQQKGRSPYCKIALQAFSYSTQLEILKWFKGRYNEKASLQQGNICMSVHMSKAFCAEIGQYVVEELRYKMPYDCARFNLTACKKFTVSYNTTKNKIRAVSRGTMSKRGYVKTSYCIEVVDNHNFLTKHGVVSNCYDTSGTFEAAMNQRRELIQRELCEFFDGYIMKLCPVVKEMCLNGLIVNEEKLTHTRAEVETEIEETIKNFPADFNHRSYKQKQKLLKEKGYRLPRKRDNATGKQKESTDALALKKLRLKYPEDQDIENLLKVSKLEKFKGSYLDFDYLPNKQVNYTFVNAGTETLRFASKLDPWGYGFNAQTIPKKAKGMFVPPEGHVWLNVDLEKAESFFVAYRSCDETLMRMLKNKEDIHSYVASKIFNCSIEQVLEEKRNGDESKRQLGKKSGHGGNYAMAAKTFQESCLKEMDLVISIKEAERTLEGYHSAFPGIRRWHKWVEQQIWDHGKLSNPLGYHRYFYGRKDSNTFREAYAWEPQSSIPMIMNYMILKAFDARTEGKLDFNLHIQCHDSALFSVRPEKLETLIAFCQNYDEWHPDVILPGGKLVIPTSAEYGTYLDKLEVYNG